MTETYFHSLRLCSSAALRYPLAFFFLNKASRFIPLRELNRWPFPLNLMCSSILTHRTPSWTSMEENKEHIKVKDLRLHSDSPNCHDLFLVHSCFFFSLLLLFPLPVLYSHSSLYYYRAEKHSKSCRRLQSLVSTEWSRAYVTIWAYQWTCLPV